MPRSRSAVVVRYALIALVIAILAGLTWWYFFLRAKEDTLRTSEEGRGAGLGIPSFGSTIGSTYGNIVSSLASLVGGAGEGSDVNILPRLRQISETPVAGMNFTSSSTLRFVERGSGYVLEARTESDVLTRLTNTLVPQVYEALITNNNVIIMRGVDEAGAIVTSVGMASTSPAAGVETPRALELRTLPQNIRAITVSPSGRELLYIREESGKAAIMRAAWNGTNPRRLASLGIVGWQVDWLPGDRIILTQNPTNNAASYAYELKENGELTAVVGASTGLSILPRAGSSALLYGTGFTLFSRVNADANFTSLPIRTTADKCVWAPGKNLIAYCAVPQAYPAGSVEERLRGEIHSVDTWWKVDVSAGSAELLYAPESSLQLDVEHPVIDGGGTYIAFMNAADKSLWLLRINQ